MNVAIVAPAARRDLDRHVLWLRSEAGAATAKRLAASAIITFATLAASPGLGSPVNVLSEEFAGLRKWHVDGFPNILFFYRSVATGIEVLRVLPAAADWHSLFDVG